MKYLSCFLSAFFLLSSCTNSSRDQKGDRSGSPEFLIAYNVLVDGDNDNYDVFLTDLEGRSATNLTNHPDVAWTYLGGSGTIWFISDRDTCPRCYQLYSMDPGGDRVKRISDIRLSDSWISARNDGKELIITPHRSVDSGFYIIDADGIILSRLYHGLAYGNDPCFSPDGKQIAFRGAQKKSKREEGFNDEIYIMDDDGQNLKRLTAYPQEDTTAPWYAYKAGPPRWNAAGNFITYQSMQQGKYSLYAVTPDGSKHWKLTSNDMNEGWHDWSPDGRWLAIEVFDDEQTHFDIALMDWGTKKIKILTDTLFRFQQGPAFVTLPD